MVSVSLNASLLPDRRIQLKASKIVSCKKKELSLVLVFCLFVFISLLFGPGSLPLKTSNLFLYHKQNYIRKSNTSKNMPI